MLLLIFNYIKMHVSMLIASVMSDSMQSPWTAAHQATLTTGFSRQKYWVPLPSLSTRLKRSLLRMTTTPGKTRPAPTPTKTKTVIQGNTATNTAHTQLLESRLNSSTTRLVLRSHRPLFRSSYAVLRSNTVETLKPDAARCLSTGAWGALPGEQDKKPSSA